MINYLRIISFFSVYLNVAVNLFNCYIFKVYGILHAFCNQFAIYDLACLFSYVSCVYGWKMCDIQICKQVDIFTIYCVDIFICLTGVSCTSLLVQRHLGVTCRMNHPAVDHKIVSPSSRALSPTTFHQNIHIVS